MERPIFTGKKIAQSCLKLLADRMADIEALFIYSVCQAIAHSFRIRHEIPGYRQRSGRPGSGERGMNELEPDSLIHIFKIQTFGKGLDSPPLTTHKG